MTFLFFIGFILIFGSGYILASGLVIWVVASLVILLLNKIFGGIRFSFEKTIKPTAPVVSAKVSLNDPIGALCVVAQKYNDFLFLKDLAFLEVRLFGRNSNAVTELFRSAQGDPRPEVCASCANKILMSLSQNRQQQILDNSWTAEQEKIWELHTPKELRMTVSEYSKSS